MGATGENRQADGQQLGKGNGYGAEQAAEVPSKLTQDLPRVLFVTRSFERGGAERQLVTLARGLHRAGWEVAVACFYDGGSLQADLEQAGIRLIDLKKRKRWDVIGFVWRLIRVFRDYEPDIVHGYMHITNMLALLARVVCRDACVVWGVRSSNVDWRRYNWLMRPTFWLSCKLARYADCIIANSQAGADYHITHGYPRARVVVIPNGIDTDRFQFDGNGRRRLRAEWRVAENEVLVGLVARLDPMKDHLTFLRAAALLTRRNAQWRFVCVGEGPANYIDELRAQAKELGLDGRLIFADAMADMAAVYSALDIVSSSSSWGEGFPNVIAEAMACERPCVVTDVGDSARVVGDCGVAVPPRNPQVLAEALEEFWARESRATGDSRVGARARTRVTQLFGVDGLVASTAGVLRALCAGERSTVVGAPSRRGSR